MTLFVLIVNKSVFCCFFFICNTDIWHTNKRATEKEESTEERKEVGDLWIKAQREDNQSRGTHDPLCVCVSLISGASLSLSICLQMHFSQEAGRVQDGRLLAE